jgi:hypothetical protein
VIEVIFVDVAVPLIRPIDQDLFAKRHKKLLAAYILVVVVELVAGFFDGKALR